MASSFSSSKEPHMKSARIRFTWKKSPSSDITSTTVVLTTNENVQLTELGPEIGQFDVVIKSNSDVKLQIKSTDSEGNEVMSSELSFHLGDLELPLPATELAYTILEVIDDEIVA